jgi:hypothetical protein
MSVGCGVNVKHPAMRYARNHVRRPILGCGIVEDGIYPTFIPMNLSTR